MIALPLAKKAHEMEPESLEIALLYINCLLDLAKSDDVIKVADKLLEKKQKPTPTFTSKSLGTQSRL
ncbi:MAG: tetratricopeptide repeat protein [Burkholderiaceae bacterium]